MSSRSAAAVCWEILVRITLFDTPQMARSAKMPVIVSPTLQIALASPPTKTLSNIGCIM